MAAFATPTSVTSLSCIGHARGPAACPRSNTVMSSQNMGLSRRDLGKIVVGTCLAGLTRTLESSVPAASAQSGKSKPTFTKDDSGIQYYDVKQGGGATPVEGDFVVIDYVSKVLLMTG